MINHFYRVPQLMTTSKAVLCDPPYPKHTFAFVMPKGDWLQSTAPWIPSWIKLKKYYMHRFVPCKHTHLLAERARSTSRTWCEKPQWETPQQTPHPRAGAPERSSDAAFLQETASSQNPSPGTPGTLAVAFLHFLISLFIAWSQKAWAAFLADSDLLLA